MKYIAVSIILFCDIALAQLDINKILYAPGEIIIRYETYSTEAKGVQISNEHQNVFEKLKQNLKQEGIEVISYTPVFENIIKEMADKNETEAQIFNNKIVNKKLNVNYTSIKRTNFSNILLLKLADVNQDIEKLAENINDNNNFLISNKIKIIYAEPNYIKKINLTSNDPLYSQQWGHKVANIEQAWQITQGSPNIQIGIIDTGVDPKHPDLINNLLPGYDFVDIDTTSYKNLGWELSPEEDYTVPDNDCSDFNGHGTHCAGIAGAVGNNGIGIKGVAPNCKILPIRVGFSLLIDDQDYGLMETTSIVNAINYAIDQGSNIISMSYGGSRSNLEEEVIKYAAYRNIVLIAAAGNTRISVKQYPAGYDEVLAITSIDKNMETSVFSSTGAWTDIAAPGEEIISTVPFTGGVISDPSGYRVLSGTSMAAPYIAGVAALLLSKSPEIINNLVYQYLRTSVTPVSSARNDFFYIGTGIIDAYKAISINMNCIAEITSPHNVDNIFVIREELAISGRASGSQFESYAFDYADYVNNPLIYQGGRPSWQPLEGSYSVPVDSGYLGTVRITQPGIYWLRLRVTSLTNIEYTDVIGPVIIDKKMKTDWTVFTGFQSLSSPAVSDIDKDENPETIFTSTDGKIYVLDQNGNNKLGWPIILPNPAPPYDYTSTQAGNCSPSVDDIDNDGEEEIIVRDGYQVYVYEHNGKIKNGWPRPISGYLNGNSLISSPVVADIDNDGEKEILVTYTGYQGSRGEIIVLKNDGNVMPGWPVTIPLNWVFSSIYSTPAVSDLDGDDNYEIIVQCYDKNIEKGYLYVFDKTGNILPGWPQEVGIGSNASPIAVDINNDGQNEIIVSSLLDENFSTPQTGIFVFNKDGKSLSSWPTILNTNSKGSGLTVGDINNDGFNEIIVGSNDSRMALYAIDRTGKIIWNIPAGTGDYILYSTPVIADINGDRKLEILISRYRIENYLGSILIVSSTGQVISESKFLIPEPILATPTISDIDNDNQLELICASQNGNIFFWDLESPNTPSGIMWPTFQLNNQRTGSIEPPRPPSGSKLLKPEDNEVNQPLKVKLNWSYAPRATSYVLQLSEYPTFDKLVINDSSLSTLNFQLDSLQVKKTYYWRVMAKNSNGTSAWSDIWNFTTVDSIIPVAIAKPSAEEIWKVNNHQKVEWHTNNILGTANIKLSLNDGATFPIILREGATNTGSTIITVPNYPSKSCRIKVEQSRDTIIFGVSDVFFIVLPSILVRYPNGTEILKKDSICKILWDSQYIDSVKIECRINNDWITIENSYPNLGEYNWTVPNMTSSFCLLKISDVGDEKIFDYSDSIFTISNLTDISNIFQQPDEYELFQNYPNPFNPNTTIRYDLPENARVRIKVYDMLGKEVIILVNDEKPAGRYSIEFDASSLASGVYFYTLQAGNYYSTKKFVLLR